MDYEFVEDLTSDVLFRAFGATKEELFENAAKAMFSVVCEIDSVKPEREIKLEISSETVEGLLYDWLSRLLAESEIQEMFFSGFKVELDGVRLIAKVYGSESNPKKGRTQVKAVTKYKFGLDETDGGWVATVSCDI